MIYEVTLNVQKGEQYKNILDGRTVIILEAIPNEIQYLDGDESRYSEPTWFNLMYYKVTQ